ncbi:MAG TPA: MFS transporter [Microscillaceae bacterium]|jgi:MFS family permease|nr:MFS transporter [Microscillaceae bacterium]
MDNTGSPLYTRQFLVLCLSTFLFFASFNMIIPELPAYLTTLGGEDYKGLIIALFALTAGLSRPISGKLADKIGRVPVMIFGAMVCLCCGFLYPLVGTLAGFFFLRFLHGLSTGFTPTGTASYLADVVAFDRRGEAMGLLGLSNSVGMAFGPVIGAYIAQETSLNTMFYTSSLVAFLAMAMLMSLRETLSNKESFKWPMLRLKANELYEPNVWPPAVVMALSTFSFGAILTVLPDFSVHLGLSNKGIAFSFFTVSSLAVRFVAGKLSDRIGRVFILKISALWLAFSMVLMGFSQEVWYFFMCASFLGLSVGMSSPTVFAWTIDLSHDQYRGRAMATVYIALEVGISLGAFFSGWLYANQASRLPWVFGLGGGLAFLAFAYLQWVLPKALVRD